MKAAPIGPLDAERLRHLYEYQLLDTLPELEYDDLTVLASAICQTPIALISLVDKDRQWFKAKVGLEISETARDISFCGHAIHETEVFVIEDAQRDQRFADNPFVTGPAAIRFYAGAQLRSPSNQVLGTLCVIDQKPCQLSPDQIQALARLARHVVTQMELRRTNQRLKLAMEEIVTQSIRLQQQQAQLTHAAELAALGGMAAGIAHEINNPISIIFGKSRVLKKNLESGSLDPQLLLKACNSIDAMVDRISKITRGLLAFSRDGSQDPMKAELIGDIIDETLIFCQELCAQHKVEIKIVKDSDVKLECNRTQISQVLLNFLSNSFDAVKSLDERWIQVKVDDLGRSLRLVVSDSGPKISDEVVARMMQPFFTTKEVGQGTGLGLSVSKGLIEAHGGVFSYLGDSPTRFAIEIPKSQSQPKNVA